MWSSSPNPEVKEYPYGGYYIVATLLRNESPEQAVIPPHPAILRMPPDEDEVVALVAAEVARRNLQERLDPGQALSLQQLRQRLTRRERVAIDNYFDNPRLTAEQKANVRTVVKDLESSAVIETRDPTVREGLEYLEEVGLLDPGRVRGVLGNL